MYFTLNHGHPRVSMKLVCSVVPVRRITVKKLTLVGRFGAILGVICKRRRSPSIAAVVKRNKWHSLILSTEEGKERAPSLLVAVVAMTELS
jgi:hypothetical protein